MNKKLERMLEEYPQMVLERNMLIRQIAHFKGITAEEVIESMYTPWNDGDCIQTSTVSDKTFQIAMSYEERMHQINREWYEGLAKELVDLNTDISFYENALASLPDPLAEMMQDMLIRKDLWDKLEVKYSVCRMTLSRYRKKALGMLSLLYDRYEQKMV